MAAKNVIAYFMHETELDEARQALANAEVTESYILGEIDEAEIGPLREKGLIVQILADAPPAAVTRARAPKVGLTIGSRGAPADVEPAETTAEPAAAPGEPTYYVLTLTATLLEPWREAIQDAGVELLERVPPNSYVARCTPEQVAAVVELPFVGGMRLYRPDDTGPVPVAKRAAPPPPLTDVPERGRTMQTFDVRLHREEDLPGVLDRLRSEGVDVAGSGGRKIRIYALEGSALPDELSALPEVATLEEFTPPKLHNDLARALLGIDDLAANPGGSQTLEGEGEIVAVADTGLDEAHPDFEGRIVKAIPRGREDDASDPHGHGTHVAGSVLGDGKASNGALRGAAPKARLVFQSLLDEQGGLGGLPVNLADLFEEAYGLGARVHNNSWGSATEAKYTMNSEEVDEFVARRRDMVVVISAGNEGQAAVRKKTAVGVVDWLSIGSPASCKNAITVGASRSRRDKGGFSKLTWSVAWPSEFPEPPIGAETVSGDPECLAAFSSRGPCDDRRIKPDVVAPGTDIASARSSRAPGRRFWGAFPGNDAYAFMGGTSMAAPLVAGCAALVREYYVKERNHSPSAALVKATLVNGARWLTGEDAQAGNAAAPNYNQGFGFVHLPSSLPTPAAPEFRLEFADSWQDAAHQFARSGQRFRFEVDVNSGLPLRICMTWTDLPARALQNNLNLFVQLPSGEKRIGNQDLPDSLGIPDPENNVEVLRIEDPPPGKYLIQVSATNLLRGPQDFALVATGALTSGLVEMS